jgi:threonine/homoserine/homoserine lactone efflux protein
MAATPGPNNTIVFSSGLNYGFFLTLPYMVGTTAGLPLMIVAVVWGFGEIFESFPQSYLYLRHAGAIYILYLSWKIATAPLPSNEGGRMEKSEEEPFERNKRCPTFWNGILFQWMNPKAWILAVTGSATYVGADLQSAKLTFYCGTFAVVTFFSLLAWCVGGVVSGRFVRSPHVYKLINGSMGLILASSVISLF